MMGLGGYYRKGHRRNLGLLNNNLYTHENIPLYVWHFEICRDGWARARLYSLFVVEKVGLRPDLGRTGRETKCA